MSHPGPVCAGNATAVVASSRYAAPPLCSGPSGDATTAVAKWLIMTGRVLPVMTDRRLTSAPPGRFDDTLDIVTCRGQCTINEGSKPIGVHLKFALGLSNEPGPLHSILSKFARPIHSDIIRDQRYCLRY